jgi:apolipoprotein N-acyltransferase
MAPRIAAAFFSGAILQFVSPPWGLAHIHWLTFVPLLWALRGQSRRQAFRLGYLSGFTGVFFLFFWLARTIDTFSNIPLALAAGVVGLFAAVWGLPYGLMAMLPGPLERRFGAAWVWLFPACWVGMEYLQPALFPYYQGVGQYRVPYTWQLASVVGAMGLTYLVLLTNSAVASALFARTRASRAHLGVVAGLFAANLGFGAWRYDEVERELAAAPVLRASILQQGVTMVQRIQDRGQDVLESWLRLTARVAGQDPELVVWPEGSIYYNPGEGKIKELFSNMTRDAAFTGRVVETLTEAPAIADTNRDSGVDLGEAIGFATLSASMLPVSGEGYSFLVGGGTTERDPKDRRRRTSWNSCYLFNPGTGLAGRYDKMVPLPFGEYLPWPFVYLRSFIEGVGNFQAGEEATVFHTPKASFTTPICYEAILESQMRRLMDADLFVNITNDGWFGDTAAPHQHAMLAAVHAVELGRPMLRIAYTGISMVVEPHGRILHETKPYTEVAEVAEIRLGAFDTPYRRWGRYFPLLASLVGAAAVWASRPGLLTTSDRAPGPPPTRG